MADNNKVVKAGIGYTVGNYLLKGLSFFTIPIFTRIMSTSDYGIFNTFGAYESIFFVFVGLALHSSYKNALYKYNEENGYYTYVSNTLVVVTVSSLIWLILFILFRNQLSQLLGIDSLCVILLIVESFSAAVLACYNADIGLRYQYKTFLAISAFNAIGNITLSIILMMTVFSNYRSMGRIIGVIIPMILIAGYIIFKCFKRAKPNCDQSMIKWGVKYSLPIIPHGISQILLNSFDRVMITKMVNVASSGLYSFGYNIYSIVAVTSSSIDTVWAPWFYEKLHAGDKKSIKKYSSLYMIFLLVFCVEVMILSPEIVKILGSKEYWDSVYCVIPIVAGGFFAFMYNIPASVEYYHEKTGFIAIATTAAAIINIVLNYVCILKWGYIAAAYTTFFTYFLYFMFHYFLAWKIEGKSLFSNLTVAICSISIILFLFISLALVDQVLIRFVIAFVILAVAVIAEEKKMNMGKVVIKKLKNKFT